MVTYSDGSPATLTDVIRHRGGAPVLRGDLARLSAAWYAGRTAPRPQLTYVCMHKGPEGRQGCWLTTIHGTLYCSRHQPGQP